MKYKKQLVFLLLFFLWPCLATAKLQVCSVTINSSDEVEIFKKHLLKTGQFEFTELVPLNEKNAAPNDIHWFTNACKRRDLHCDIMIISGHFGGIFFGENHTYILPVDIMERQSCSKSCPGLLNVKEVYLFGCNTLATKQPDHRSPEEYLQVLLDHNMAGDMAEIVVAGRYLPFGLSFKEQMQMVFLDNIYGFTSLSPLGKDIRVPLDNYFHEINRTYGSYFNYMKQKTPISNRLIRNTIGGTVAVTKGAGPDDRRFNKMCYLYRDDVKKVQGMRIIQELIQSGKGPKAYLSIKAFISKHKPFTGRSNAVFNEIKNNQSFRNEFLPLYRKISPLLPYIRLQFLNFLHFFQWVNDSFYKQELKTNVLRMVRRPTSESYDYATALVYDEHIPIQALNLTEKDLPNSFYKNLWSALIMETLGVQDYRAHRKLMNQACISTVEKNPVHCYQVLKSLGHLQVSDSALIHKMADFLKIPAAGLIYYAMYGLGYSGAQVSSIHQSIAYHCNNPEKWFQKLSNINKKWIRLQVMRSLALLKPKDKKTNNTLINCMQAKTANGDYVITNEEIIYEGLKALSYMNPSVHSMRKLIKKRKLNKHKNKNISTISRRFL